MLVAFCKVLNSSLRLFTKLQILFYGIVILMDQKQLFTILDDVESTNNYAMGKLHAGLAVHGEAWFARNQWGGRGQRENQWESNKDENLLLTIILKPDKVFRHNIFHFNIIVACICHEFLAKIAGKNTFIKWPNDLYFNDRKAGGILIENVFSGQQWEWAIVGIGININQTNFNLVNNRTSLKSITNLHYNPIELAKVLHQKVIKNLEMIDYASQDSYLNYYNDHLFKKNETVKLKKDNIVFKSTIKEVNSQGQLVTFDTIERQFNSSEIKWVLED